MNCSSVEICVHCTENRFIHDIRITVITKRRIKFTSIIHTVKAIITCFIQI